MARLADFCWRQPHAEIIWLLEHTGPDELGPYVSIELIAGIPGFSLRDIESAYLDLENAQLLDEFEHPHTRERMIGLKTLTDQWLAKYDERWDRVRKQAEALGLTPQWMASTTKAFRLVDRAGTILAEGPLWRIAGILGRKVR